MMIADVLHDRKLNANCFEPADGKIWHVPGFSAFDHRCPNKPSTPPARTIATQSSFSRDSIAVWGKIVL
jgi:hypothetical protein